MRLLVLGGTGFLGGAVAAEGVRRGHEVICAARGHTGPAPGGARLVVVDRDQPEGLAALAGTEFDATVELAALSYPWVATALRALAGRVRHWSFVSTINVYADCATLGLRADAPLLEPLRAEGFPDGPDPYRYGAIKVAGEDAVRAATGGRAFVVRPGSIVGPGDASDRFGYWPARLSRGGRVVVPDVPAHPAQHVDVRDLAAWLVDAGERELAGDFDAIGRPRPWLQLLAEIAELAGPAQPVEFVPIAPEALAAAGVTRWSGPRSLPGWLPATHYGVQAHDPASSLAAGLHPRPLADTVAAVLAHERRLGLDRPRKAGLTAADEAGLLATLA
jgi:nucleoside-diphosphate-sugar epimerase